MKVTMESSITISSGRSSNLIVLHADLNASLTSVRSVLGVKAKRHGTRKLASQRTKGSHWSGIQTRSHARTKSHLPNAEASHGSRQSNARVDAEPPISCITDKFLTVLRSNSGIAFGR